MKNLKKSLIAVFAFCNMAIAQDLEEEKPVSYIQKEQKGDTLSLAKLVEPKKGVFIHTKKHELIDPMIKYELNILGLNGGLTEDQRQEKSGFFEKEITKTDLKDDPYKDVSNIFNNKMLNLLFADKIGTNFGGSTDLSLQKFYTSIDNKDNSVSLGTNIDTRGGDKLNKLSLLLSASLKMKSSDNFATVLGDEGNFKKENIGLTLKGSYIFGGKINFTSDNNMVDRRKAILKYRDQLREKYKTKTKKFNEESLKEFCENHLALLENNKKLKSLDVALIEKQNEWYKEIAEAEIKFLETYNMYRFVSNFWTSLELYLPFSEEEKNISSKDALMTITEKSMWNASALLTANYMRDYSNGQAYFTKISLGAKNNNTLLVNNLSSQVFQKTATAADGFSYVSETENVYLLDDYEEFGTISLAGEVAYFFFNSDFGNIGVSPAIEANFGTYDKVNWKIGIPISLKDKEGKPKINFEFMLKTQKTFTKTESIVGVSTNFLFGKLIN